jgi:hypothetical protein
MRIFNFLHWAEKAPPGKGGVVSTEKDDEMLESVQKVLGPSKSETLFTADGSDMRRAKAWLDAQLKRMAKTGRFTLEEITITPGMAEILLTLNVRNRRIRRARVAKIVKALREGRWKYTGDIIRVASDGTLIDGQHRLLAIIEAGRSAVCDVKFGLDPEVFKVLDTQASRSGCDTFHIDGIENSALAAAVCRLVIHYDAGMPRGRQAIDNDDLLQFARDNPDIAAACTAGQTLAQRHNLKCAPTPIATAYFLINRSRANRDQSARFFETLRTGLKVVRRRDPAKVLREYIMKDRRAGEQFANEALLANILIAWAAYKAGKGITTVEPVPGSGFPEVA